ncbi:SLBB domain-containing protein [Chitinispirillales bacterium ANBcel5]|uniref:polysaccharide biosynthesis/export family protein n=1 Tax=Cellulosispirillum alkaliphilum TaxID=3039283 RepID=UPI002A529F33|nr:SLBB domain-containing protein [Chitinispirillales bacterium ANBcel5]
MKTTLKILSLIVINLVITVSALDLGEHQRRSSSTLQPLGAEKINGNGDLYGSASSRPSAFFDYVSIDESTYLIGGGDRFFISFISNPTLRYTATIDRRGNLYIPELGLIEIGKRASLLEAKETIKNYLKSVSNEQDFYVSLIQPKTVNVNIYGILDNQGAFEFSGNTRLFDAIKMANEGKIPPNGDIRRIQVVNRGEIKEFDLKAFLYLTDDTQNPYLNHGDKIRVLPVTRKVTVNGPVLNPPPGVYSVKEGETLADFLSLFTFDESADTSRVELHKTSSSQRNFHTISDNSAVLSNLDVINIPPKKNHPRIKMVHLTGEIARPGVYSIIKDVTTARMAIENAGGGKESGNLDRAVIIRHGKHLPERFSHGASKLSGVRPELSTSLSMISSTSDHAIIRLSDSTKDVILKKGDQIYVPKLDDFVYLSGSVNNPGAYPYVPGQNRSYYISQAGGLARNASRTNIQVVKRYGEAVQVVDTNEIEPGDIITVPASQQYRFLSTVFIPIITAIATTVSVGLAIYNTAK